MATNRIGGDFNGDAIEAFRAAYAQQLQTAEELDLDQLSGLPSNVVSNTSPWYSSVGLWKYPSGKGPEDDLKAPFNPQDHYTVDEEEEEDEEKLTDEEVREYLNSLSDEEFDNFGRDLGLYGEDEEDEDDGEVPMTDDEIDSLISELLDD